MISVRGLIAILALTMLAGCATCAPGTSKLDQSMVAKTSSASQ